MAPEVWHDCLSILRSWYLNRSPAQYWFEFPTFTYFHYKIHKGIYFLKVFLFSQPINLSGEEYTMVS